MFILILIKIKLAWLVYLLLKIYNLKRRALERNILYWVVCLLDNVSYARIAGKGFGRRKAEDKRSSCVQFNSIRIYSPNTSDKYVIYTYFHHFRYVNIFYFSVPFILKKCWNFTTAGLFMVDYDENRDWIIHYLNR